ncbi:plasminogen receptor (KT)-like [Acanthaster planci]|uniref:Plasminogen receptor (KT)-like n=1 Tax=Acanthaster planci TaxID=133434 RepID=A0A8B7YWX7_ACAPL|nr:plasminogen receptor (KT)-like [Acanthaster planci]XP_022097197.1 plasminogen receptor (KT)-like [Acanthaster planci]XP_022097198.1 plasminogen receptor (KT)-like [Acanthaster planci]
MGSMMAKAMDENFQKNKEFMQGIQETMLERQIQMQNQMREKSVAMQLSGSREMFNWIASFYGVVTVTCLAGFMKRKNPAVLIPLLPLTFIVAYQYDYTYGTKVLRIREGAEAILKEERQLLPVPLGLPNLASIDAARDATKSS